MADVAKKTTDYIVQCMVVREGEPDSWLDVAAIVVPAGSHRHTVIRKALDDPETILPHTPAPFVFRALDADSARTVVAEWKQPPAQLVIT